MDASARNQPDPDGRDAATPGYCAQLILESHRASARARSTSYPFIAGDTPKTTTCSVSRPRSTRAMFSRLFVNRPAEIKQRHRQRDLRGGEREAEARRGFRARRLPRVRFQRRHEVRATYCEAPETARRAGPSRATACAANEHHLAVDVPAQRAEPPGSIAGMALRVQRATRSPASPPATASSIDSVEQLGDDVLCARRQSTDARPSPSRARPRAPAADSRRSRSRSAARCRDAEEERERTAGFVRSAALAQRAGLELHLPCFA